MLYEQQQKNRVVTFRVTVVTEIQWRHQGEGVNLASAEVLVTLEERNSRNK